MFKENNPGFPIKFSKEMYEAFIGLVERGFMTPTYLSKLLMLIVLPAQSSVVKDMRISNDEGFFDKDKWFERSKQQVNKDFQDYFVNKCSEKYDEMRKTHEFSSFLVDGLETLEAKQIELNANQPYEIFCCGNGQDAMQIEMANFHIKSNPNKNYIFWNYPGVGYSKNSLHSVHDLFKAGYLQAKRLIDQGIPAEHITLHGLSLGGGVATHVARQLHEEGHLVNLKIDRSFACIAWVIPEILKQLVNKSSHKNFKQLFLSSLIISTIAFALYSVALGTTIAGFLASIGLVIASAIAGIGYVGALGLQAVGFILQEIMTLMGTMIAYPVSIFSKSISEGIQSLFKEMGFYLSYPFYYVAFAINQMFSTMGLLFDRTINSIAGILGVAIAIGGLVGGVIAGLIFSALFSIQLLWTKETWMMPINSACSAVVSSLCCEMDSVNEMYRLLKADMNPENKNKRQPQISVTNVMDDEVIVVTASLNWGLGLKPGKHFDGEKSFFEGKVKSFWYRSGGHNGELQELVDSNQIFEELYVYN